MTLCFFHTHTVACACLAMAINGAPLVLAVGCISLFVAPVIAYQRYLLGNMESKLLLLLLLLLSHLIFIFLLLFSPNNDFIFFITFMIIIIICISIPTSSQ